MKVIPVIVFRMETRKIRRIIVWVAIIPSKYVFFELFRFADRRSLL